VNGFADFNFSAGRGFYRPAQTIDLEGAVSLVAAALNYAREQGLTQLLVDTRQLTGHEPPNTFQRYELMNRWLAASQGRVQLALVVRPEMMDPERFAIRVAENRGFLANAFVDEETAVAWLDD
jgi:hypothetical protein